MPKPKRGKMKDIRINEVSMVDKPANKLPFLFFKREGEQGVNLLNKKKKIKIEIESNGLVGGTKVSINGEALGKLRSFDFSFWGDDPKQTIHASYSKVAESEDGFSRTETYYLTKGEMTMDPKTLKLLQEYLGTEDIDFEKKVEEETVQEALELITGHYQDSFPEDLEKAIGVLAKRASGGYQVKEKEAFEKAGAKFSKDVIKKLQAVITAVETLKSMMPDLKGATEKADGSESEEVAELTKKLAELKDIVAKLDPEKKADAKTETGKLTKELETLSKRVKAMEEGGATKKSIDAQENDTDDEQKGAGEGGKPLWPTLTGQKKE